MHTLLLLQPLPKQRTREATKSKGNQCKSIINSSRPPFLSPEYFTFSRTGVLLAQNTILFYRWVRTHLDRVVNHTRAHGQYDALTWFKERVRQWRIGETRIPVMCVYPYAVTVKMENTFCITFQRESWNPCVVLFPWLICPQTTVETWNFFWK